MARRGFIGRALVLWLLPFSAIGLGACSHCPPCSLPPLSGDGTGLLDLSQDYYVVRATAGDTYMSLAWEHNVSPYDVVELNEVKAPYRLEPGDLVRIPAPRIHIVRRGDTLMEIARSYRVGFYDLAQANAINAPYTIYPGQVLRLPSKRPWSKNRPEPPVHAWTPPPPEPSLPAALALPSAEAEPRSDPLAEVLPEPSPKPFSDPAPEPAAPPAEPAAEVAVVLPVKPQPKPEYLAAPTPSPKAENLAAPNPPPKAESLAAASLPPEPASPATADESPKPARIAAANPPPRVPEEALHPKPRPKPPTMAGGEEEGRTLIWPVKGRIISDFGPTSNGRHNDGINIAVPERTPVRAAADGVVIYRGNEVPGYGNLVLIRHDNDLITAYAHNSAFKVEKGERVKRGQLIALSGSTGNVEEPQLHFEVRRGVKAVDPKPHLKA